MSMLLSALRLCLAFFGLGDPGLFHCEDCCLVSGIIPVDPTLVPSDDPRHEGWVIQGMLTKLLTNCNTVLFLFGGQKPGHELCSNVVHVQIKCENCLHCSILTIAAVSLKVL